MKNSILGLVAALAALFISQNPLAAAPKPYIWKNVTVGAGGFIPGIVFSRVEKGLAYLRSDMGGCYRWDDAQKTWIPLDDALAESSYMGGESIAPDPVDADTVYVAAGMYRSDPAAMLRSHDRGKNWDIFPVSFKMGGNEDGRGVGERMAVDPNDTHILFFGSRHDGLMRSDDKAQTWKRMEGFPLHGLGLPEEGRPTHTGLSFVVFDPHSSSKGTACKTIFVGSTDPGPEHLFRTDDAGQSWRPVSGGPGSNLLPAKAELDDSGLLYITYGDGTGPNGVKAGAVFVLDIKSNQWTDITPEKHSDRPGGYCGLSVDRQRRGTIAVSTIDRWNPSDTVWRTTDGGRTWHDIAPQSERDVSLSPYLLWGKKKASFGWWIAALAIDPFDSDHVAYGTGATVFAANDFSNVTKGLPTHWSPWIHGIEQTAIETVMSPTDGPHLVSGFGDIDGFTHFNLDVSPPQGMFGNPRFNTTVALDYAGSRPRVIVRAGRPEENEPTIALSQDSGTSWKPLDIPLTAQSETTSMARQSDQHISVSADGEHILVSAQLPVITTDSGVTWKPVQGLPPGGHAIADRVDPNLFYCLSADSNQIDISRDGGRTFQLQAAMGIGNDNNRGRSGSMESRSLLLAVPGVRGELWLVSDGGLMHSIDGGKRFALAPGDLHVELLSFGKAPAGHAEPALFAIGTQRGTRGIWRSDDSGNSWDKINDVQHEWGRRFRCIAGDPRIIGRVYFGTDGRGVFYGDESEAN